MDSVHPGIADELLPNANDVIAMLGLGGGDAGLM